MNLSTFSLIGLFPLLAACGGSEKPPEVPESEPEPERRDDYDPTRHIEASAEIGALPEEQTVEAFRNSFEDIQECFIQGARKIEFIGGDIAFVIQVNSGGEAEYVYAKHTTLGDRNTEKCMFRALKNASWPAPVGGPIGMAENSFAFEMTGDVRPPVMWDVEQIEEALGELSSDIYACKRGKRGRFTATLYVDRDGSPISAGISAPDKDGEAQSDCLVDVLLHTTYPSPGSWPAKVSFDL